MLIADEKDHKQEVLMFAIFNKDRPETCCWYKHGYPVGSWVSLGSAQMYASKGAASRQISKLNKEGWGSLTSHKIRISVAA